MYGLTMFLSSIHACDFVMFYRILSACNLKIREICVIRTNP